MKKLNNSALFFALLTSFTMATGANALDDLSAEAQQSLEPSHQGPQGFEAGQHRQYAHFPAAKHAIARRVRSMSPEEREAARAKFQNRAQNRAQSQIKEQGQERDQLQTL